MATQANVPQALSAEQIKAIFKEARKSKDLSSALKAIARLEHQIELEARLLGNVALEHQRKDDNALLPLETIRKAIKPAEEADGRLEVVVERATIRGVSDNQTSPAEPKQILEVS